MTYTIEVCNTGVVTVTADSVIDSLLGDITRGLRRHVGSGRLRSEAMLTRTVAAGDPDPLMNTVTATYSGRQPRPRPRPVQRPTCSSLASR